MGPKQLIAMVSGKHDVSCETEAEKRGAKVSYLMVHFLRYGLERQPPFQDPHYTSTMFFVCPAMKFFVDKNSVKYGVYTNIVPRKKCKGHKQGRSVAANLENP